VNTAAHSTPHNKVAIKESNDFSPANDSEGKDALENLNQASQ